MKRIVFLLLLLLCSNVLGQPLLNNSDSLLSVSRTKAFSVLKSFEAYKGNRILWCTLDKHYVIIIRTEMGYHEFWAETDSQSSVTSITDLGYPLNQRRDSLLANGSLSSIDSSHLRMIDRFNSVLDSAFISIGQIADSEHIEYTYCTGVPAYYLKTNEIGIIIEEASFSSLSYPCPIGIDLWSYLMRRLIFPSEFF